ncbi:hypothetical protein IE53DRAFT_139255 [Violaceomyces palustris]|uniref:Uncharacterized protein n=1 Tax=Violaceomyces palustris TaxID=1673888 RepID=A0ACD0NUM1_9BASI|nr:hypothetical protein IE53DRAFT_139255 [Violaceomyces palustris]
MPRVSAACHFTKVERKRERGGEGREIVCSGHEGVKDPKTIPPMLDSPTLPPSFPFHPPLPCLLLFSFLLAPFLSHCLSPSLLRFSSLLLPSSEPLQPLDQTTAESTRSL